MTSGFNKPPKVQNLTFWQEFRERSGFIGVVAITNPLCVTFYVMFLHNAPGGMQFWLVGLLLTAIVCLISTLFMAMVIFAERRRRQYDFKREVMYHDAMPYDGLVYDDIHSKAG